MVDTIKNEKQKEIDLNRQRSLNPIENRRRGNWKAAKIEVVSITNNLFRDKNLELASSNLSVGESMQFHYFPSEITEELSQNYNVSNNSRNAIADVKWSGSGARKVKFKAFFNELGDNAGFVNDRKASEQRKGFLSVSDSIEFLREIMSPSKSRITGKLIEPPFIALFGLFDREPFFGVLTGLSINVTNWSSKVNQVTTNRVFDINTISLFSLIPFELELKGSGHVPIRATADIEITSSIRNFRNRIPRNSKRKK